jgi:hypothetical protein
MLCVGSIGLKHFTEGRVGSTAATLVARAHCPVAMIRGHGGATSSKPGWVVVEVDESVESSVLQLGVEEAQLRGAPLRAITAWRSRFTDIHDVRAASEGNRQVRAHLDRSLACWRRRYPDLDLRSVAVHGSAVNYLAKHAADIQLVVGAVAIGAMWVIFSDRPVQRPCTTPIAPSLSAIGVNGCECPRRDVQYRSIGDRPLTTAPRRDRNGQGLLSR